MTAATTNSPRTQAERSAATKRQLIDAAISCLIENGYAQTTMVEVCSRAGLTRGALHHHFANQSALLIAVIEKLYEAIGRPSSERSGAEPGDSLEGLIREGWSRVSRPEFKAIIEIWLAARNNAELGKELHPAIAKLSLLFSSKENPHLARVIGGNPENASLYRVAFEAMIGLALGRATSPNNAPVAHEDDVIESLVALARAASSRTPD